jgi:hypothetical protein
MRTVGRQYEGLGSLKDGELLLAYARLMEELRSRGIVRSSNNPVADFTEFLVARAHSALRLRASQPQVMTP